MLAFIKEDRVIGKNSQASGPTPRRLARSAAPGARLRADLQRLARREKPKTALAAARGFCKLRKSWSKVCFPSETKPGRRRSAPGPENQIPIPSRPAFRRSSKARINKGEALGNQRDRASGLNLTVAAVISRDTIYLGNAVASFPSKPQHRPWSVSLQTRGSCGQNSLKASRSPAAITSVC
jgi:hypothetical protein